MKHDENATTIKLNPLLAFFVTACAKISYWRRVLAESSSFSSFFNYYMSSFLIIMSFLCANAPYQPPHHNFVIEWIYLRFSCFRMDFPSALMQCYNSFDLLYCYY